MSILQVTHEDVRDAGGSLAPIIESLNRQRAAVARVPVAGMLALLDDFAARLLGDERTRTIEGVAFLSAWLGRRNLPGLVELNLNGNPAYVDGFVGDGRSYLAARPHGLVAMWLAGNVGTLPLFSLAPALLAKNVCLLKLAHDNAAETQRLLAVLADSQVEGLSGSELLRAVAVVWFDHRDTPLSEAMSLAADAKVIWGGESAVRAITRLPRHEHCVEIVFGPKYSIGLVGRAVLEADGRQLDDTLAAFARDVGTFDQRACSAPQTIFIERNSRRTLRQVGELLGQKLARLPAKPRLDAYTTAQILNARARWAMGEGRDVIASADGANWTVCMDRELRLKEAVQSRTVFLTEIGSWRELVPLLGPKVQTVGLALGDADETMAFAEAATQAGVVRCVRPGLMNNYESPWDGKLVLSQLVRWVTLKP